MAHDISDVNENKEVKEIRYSIPVSTETDKVIMKYVPWGVKARLILNLINLLADYLEQNGPEIIGSLLNNEVKISIVKRQQS